MIRRRRPSLIVFARRPRLGRGKRRLAADVGDLAAWRFQRANLVALCRRPGRDPRWRTRLALTPDDADRREIRGMLGPWRRGIAVEGQGRGDLGERMRRALVRHRPAILIGADIPGVTERHVADAFALLSRRDLVFGPATDGGFWLVGVGARRAVPRTLFRRCRWSTRHALADALAGVSPDRSLGLTRVMADVDDGGDLERARNSGITGL